MPIPFLVAGALLVGGAVLGTGAHISAQDTNERAQKIANEAEELYDKSKHSLELAQRKTEKSLVSLGNHKKKVLDTSIAQFLDSYEKIKNVQLNNSIGLNEISKFFISSKDAIQLREMSNIYNSAFASGATGAAAGAAIALAASGALPVVGGVLSTAGTALIAGQFGIAASLTGTALSFGAAMTPLAAVVAPVILFTGISSDMKADENLEKAQAMRSEARVASEKMKTAETKCNAITKRSEMYDKLLKDLDYMFSQCASLMDEMVKKKLLKTGKSKLSSQDFSEDELKLIAVTRSLAGAVKAVIDVPILSNDGDLTSKSENLYDEMSNNLVKFRNTVLSCTFDNKTTELEHFKNVKKTVNNSIDSEKEKISKIVSILEKEKNAKIEDMPPVLQDYYRSEENANIILDDFHILRRKRDIAYLECVFGLRKDKSSVQLTEELRQLDNELFSKYRSRYVDEESSIWGGLKEKKDN